MGKKTSNDFTLAITDVQIILIKVYKSQAIIMLTNIQITITPDVHKNTQINILMQITVTLDVHKIHRLIFYPLPFRLTNKNTFVELKILVAIKQKLSDKRDVTNYALNKNTFPIVKHTKKTYF